MSQRDLHQGTGIQEPEGLRPGVRLRNLLADRPRSLSRMSQKQLHVGAAHVRLQGVRVVSVRHVHVPAVRSQQGFLQRYRVDRRGPRFPREPPNDPIRFVRSQMPAGPIFGDGFGAVLGVPGQLLSDGQRTDRVHGVSDQHEDERRGRGEPRRVPIDRVRRELVLARRTVRAARPRDPVLLSGRVLGETLRRRH